MSKWVTDSYTEVGFWGEVQFRRQKVLPVHENCSLDMAIYSFLLIDHVCGAVKP
jgi:hypothetical protein